MEDVMTKLQTTNITEVQHKKNFDGLYKFKRRFGNQEERRQELLKLQKSQRQTDLDYCRGILGLVSAVEENDNVWENSKPRYRPSIYVAGFHRASPSYKNVLMLSEWMVERPEDFETNWFVVPCPKGIRMLVVANNGITKFYTKYGQFKFEKRTELPGGNKSGKKWEYKCCVLDCFYVELINTMFVMDILAWNEQTMTDGETEFRHYWMVNKLLDTPLTQNISKKNEVVFKVLPKYPCDKDSFNRFMMIFPHFENHVPTLDGLLFYHKKGHYFGGETPLVGWLFPYMVPEILGSDIPVNPAYMLEKPINYTNQTEYIEKFKATYGKKIKVPKSSMDVDNQTQKYNESKEQENMSNMEEAATEELLENENTMDADANDNAVKT